MLLSIRTGEKTVLCDTAGAQSTEAGDGDGGVWVEGRYSPYLVYLYDLKTGES